MFYIEDLVVVIQWLAIAVAIIDVLLVGYILIRRVMRQRYYQRKDLAKQQFSGAVDQFASGAMDLSLAVTALRPARGFVATTAVQELLLASITEQNRESMTKLLRELGYIQKWAKQAFGSRRAHEVMEAIVSGKNLSPGQPRKFRLIRRLRALAVKRALPVAHFGKLAPQYAEKLLTEALRDPSAFVTRSAISALGKTFNPLAGPILIEQLRQTIHGQSEIPARSAKAALVRQAAEKLPDFLPFLENPEEHFRLLVVDTIREILNVNPSLAASACFPKALYQWFMSRATVDVSADVRARSAAIIGRFHDANSVEALRTLLRDENEYVRLHAARACGDPFYAELADSLVECMTDRRWRVRESAAKALAALGNAGARYLANFFLDTSDRYASEQIADELQRSGQILHFVQMLGSHSPEADRAAAVCSKMAHMGMISLFKHLLQRELPAVTRNELLKILATLPQPILPEEIPAFPEKRGDLSQKNAVSYLDVSVSQMPIVARK